MIRLPVGTFAKEVDVPEYGSARITWTYSDNERVLGRIEANVMGCEIEVQTESEIAMSRHGTIDGLVTSAKVTHLKLGGELAAANQYVKLLPLIEPVINDFLTDLPFSYQFRMTGDRLTITQFRILLAGPNPVSKIGPALSDFQFKGGDLAGLFLYAQTLGVALEGNYGAVEADEKPAPRPPFRKPPATKSPILPKGVK